MKQIWKRRAVAAAVVVLGMFPGLLQGSIDAVVGPLF